MKIKKVTMVSTSGSKAVCENTQFYGCVGSGLEVDREIIDEKKLK